MIHDTQWYYDEGTTSAGDEASALGAPETWAALDLYGSYDDCEDPGGAASVPTGVPLGINGRLGSLNSQLKSYSPRTRKPPGQT